jgi:Transposase, Mutator family
MGHAGRGDRVAESLRSVRAVSSRRLLQPRKRSEQALVSAVQQAYVCGVSTQARRSARREPVTAHQQAAGVADRGAARGAGRGFREPPLEGRYPSLFVDAKIEKVRDLCGFGDWRRAQGARRPLWTPSRRGLMHVGTADRLRRVDVLARTSVQRALTLMCSPLQCLPPPSLELASVRVSSRCRCRHRDRCWQWWGSWNQSSAWWR